ncbi:MAG: chemotaxis response regulator protein-glutamate methylesterase [Myxococcales bacterium]|nr:chemotaxis response regulator protein-glutamate methylesterase [Myxococcales bacterium]
MSVPRVRVLVVDDSAVARKVLSEGLASDPRFEVVGAARDAWEARDLIVRHDPRVITLDVEMPRMDGIEFLRRLMASHPVRAVVVSSLTEKGSQVAMDALREGAVEVVAKPTRNLAGGTAAMLSELRTKVLIASTARLQRPVVSSSGPIRRALANTTHKLVAIGASTGGTEAIRQVLSDLPPHFPGIAIVQHMPPGFTAPFAARLDEVTRFEVKEAVDGDRIFPGRCVVAPAGRQMRVVRSGGDYVAKIGESTKVSGHCPSVDVMFHSVASAAGSNAVGMLLTGMGADGADGLGAMRKAGAKTFAQDEASSVVWGMPRAAWEAGAAERLVALSKVADTLMSALEDACLA